MPHNLPALVPPCALFAAYHRAPWVPPRRAAGEPTRRLTFLLTRVRAMSDALRPDHDPSTRTMTRLYITGIAGQYTTASYLLRVLGWACGRGARTAGRTPRRGTGRVSSPAAIGAPSEGLCSPLTPCGRPLYARMLRSLVIGCGLPVFARSCSLIPTTSAASVDLYSGPTDLRLPAYCAQCPADGCAQHTLAKLAHGGLEREAIALA